MKRLRVFVGGGLHHPLRQKKVTIRNLDPDYSPLFHYLSIQRCGSRRVVTSNQLTEDRTGFSLGKSFAISLP